MAKKYPLWQCWASYVSGSTLSPHGPVCTYREARVWAKTVRKGCGWAEVRRATAQQPDSTR